MELKRWKELVHSGALFHYAAIDFRPGRIARLHTHDFPELFWIERGTGVHHINGRSLRIVEGDLVLVRPSDSHRLEAVDADGFELVNLAFHPNVRRELLKRHPSELGLLLAPAGELPFRLRLAHAELRSLRRQADLLNDLNGTRLRLEFLLLGLAVGALSAVGPKATSMPEWLRLACAAARLPEIFGHGTVAFARAAGRSPEHLARTMRAVLWLTPSAFLNQVRMEHAARELRVTARPIIDICLECGISNLSHFYALFRACHGVPPRAYRQKYLRAVV